MANDATEVSDSQLCSLAIEAGVKLLSPPSSVAGILSVLDSAESLLSSLGQGPSQELRDALLPAMKGLISDRLFKHCNVDIKVSVLSCIHELVRLAAPDTPYKDECMKVIFQQTVNIVFGKLSSLSGRPYEKAVQILYTVAKVRSGLILLDLGCNALISRMFQIFIDTIRPNHPDAVFSNMEEIMTSLIQESDDLSLDLLKPLITVVNKDNQIISPPSRILAEKVLKNCSEKVKPYLTKLVEQLRKDASACSFVIASIWHDMPALENVMEEAGKDVSDFVPKLVGGKSIQVDSSISSSEDEQASKVLVSHEQSEKLQIVDIESAQTDAGGSEGGLGTKAWVEILPDRNKNTSMESPVLKQVELLQIVDDKSVQPDTLQTEGKMGIEASREVLAVGRKNSSKRLMGQEEIEQLQMFAKESVRPDALEAGGEVLPSGGEKNSKALAGNEQIAQLQNIPPKEYAKPDDFRTEGQRMKACQYVLPARGEEKPEEVHSHSVVSGGKGSSEKPRKRKNYEKQKSSPENILLSEYPQQSNPVILEQITSSGKDITLKKRKTNLSDSGMKGKTSECDAEVLPKGYRKPRDDQEYREELIGSRVLVWWPADQQFYEGAVEAYDPVKKEHKVAYLDGDVEILRLQQERWLLHDEISTVRHYEKPKTVKEYREEIVGSRVKVSLPHDHEFFEGIVETYDPIKKENKVVYLDDVAILRLENDCWLLHDEISAARCFEDYRSVKEYCEEIVGSRVKVWWPADHEYYEGIVETYDPIKKEHKVVYLDGDVEILRLENERWLLHVEIRKYQEANLPNSSAAPLKFQTKADRISRGMEGCSNLTC
ncbi:OLC1v1005874C1 [Oldenlandia corymbosa var. corymbosa]|uniref:OLC1v1005874C1 n=1 Tax=Oldenlandia corymbosa var. corymbosa TaxID=529605 RepID=A0AAV1DG05_OLDCO|nr:OLC1v1005874C1 [Oldenlandia corymbosa var. corymbosa]